MSAATVRCASIAWLAVLWGLGLPALAIAGPLPDYVEQLIAQTPVYQGVMRRARVTDAVMTDLDGDGIAEVAVGFDAGGRGGLVVFRSKDAGYVPVFGGVWRDAVPRRVEAEGPMLTLVLERRTARGLRRYRERLGVGRGLGPLDGARLGKNARVEASSTLFAHRASTDPSALVDGDVESGWAEGSHGTGVGERVTLEFRAPVDIGWLGLAPGHGTDRAIWSLSNRPRRAALRIETQPPGSADAERTTQPGRGRRRIDIELADVPGFQYVDVDGEAVRRLEIEITSVYLGERFDDAWISEVDVFVLLPEPTEPLFLIDPLRPRPAADPPSG